MALLVMSAHHDTVTGALTGAEDGLTEGLVEE